MYSQISCSSVVSMRIFTRRASSRSVAFSRAAVMIGVLMFFFAFISSLIRGTPCVMFIDATPAK